MSSRSTLSVLHVMPFLHPMFGGPPIFLPTLVSHLGRHGVNNTIAVVGLPGEAGTISTSAVVSFPCEIKPYRISMELATWLRRSIHQFDLVHVHYLFTWSSLVGSLLARRRRIPYIVQPHGVLSEWGLVNRRPQLKKLWLAMTERRILGNAAAIICTTQEEIEESQRVLSGNRYVCIPYAVERPQASRAILAASFMRAHPDLVGHPIAIFLSRIDPKKGLEVLLSAWKSINRRFPKARLLIAGTGPHGYVQKLQSIVRKMGISEAAIFVGLMSEFEKWQALAAASVFVLPSYSESFGMAVLEALSIGTPVIISNRIPVSKVVQAGLGGIVLNVDPAELTKALDTLLSDAAICQEMSTRAYELSSSFAGLDEVARRMKDLYDQVIRNV